MRERSRAIERPSRRSVARTPSAIDRVDGDVAPVNANDVAGSGDLDAPASIAAAPNLDAALVLRDKEVLLERRRLFVGFELLALVARRRGRRQHFDDDLRVRDRLAEDLTLAFDR